MMESVRVQLWRWGWGLLLLVSLVIKSSHLGDAAAAAASFDLEAVGSALLRFKEGIEHDPFGALSNWAQNQNQNQNHCSWYGVICSDDLKVVALNLPDLALKGTISPKIGKLNHLKILDLSNNSFYGVIPREIGELKQLVVLDLRNNTLSGTLSSDLDNISSLKLLLINGNMIMGELSPKLHELAVISQVIEEDDFEMSERRQLRSFITGNANSEASALALAESPASAPSPSDQSPSPSPSPAASPSDQSPSPSPLPSGLSITKQPAKSSVALILGVVFGGVVFLAAIIAVYMLYFRDKKVINIAPWRTGLSGPISKALIAGIPSVGRTELDAACEGFSNIIFTSSHYTMCKGTLSNGSEIAVVSTLVKSPLEWPDTSENQFKHKLSVLSKINHKNFMNLLGYCKVDDPFTRMMVVEYAPNGTLWEHLHIKEAEQLDWSQRLRIAMGIIYCLEYLESCDPPARLKTLNSSTIYLSEDYAAKVSDINFWADTKKGPFVTVKKGNDEDGLDEEEEEPVVYKYAILLLELVSGRLPFSEDTGLLVLWASSYLTGKRPLMSMVDPTLDGSVSHDLLMPLCELIKSCINPNTDERPSVPQVAKIMKDISGVSPQVAIPRDSPLWWAELEISSTEGS